VDAATRVLARQVFDVDHAMTYWEQRLAFSPDIRMAGFKLGQPGVAAVIVMDKGWRSLKEAGSFGTRE